MTTASRPLHLLLRQRRGIEQVAARLGRGVGLAHAGDGGRPLVGRHLAPTCNRTSSGSPVTRHSVMKSSARAARRQAGSQTQHDKAERNHTHRELLENRRPAAARPATISRRQRRCLFRLDAGLFDDRPPQVDLRGELGAVRLGRRLVERQQDRSRSSRAGRPRPCRPLTSRSALFSVSRTGLGVPRGA